MVRDKLTGGFRSDPVYFLGLAVSAVALLVATVFLLARPVVLHRFALPFAEAFLSPDRVIEQNTMNLLDGLIVKIGTATLMLGILGLCYTFVWRFFSSRLPAVDSATAVGSFLPVSKLEICLLLTVLALALTLRLHSITRGLTHDEIFTALRFIEADSFWKTVASHFRSNNHIAFSILARLSEAMFGRHEWALRLPSLLLGLGSLYCLWALGRKLLGPRTALTATLCLAVSRVHVEYSVSARGYAGMILFTFLSSYLYFELLDRPTRRNGFMFVLISVVGMYFLLYSALVTVVQIVFLLYLGIKEVLTNNSGHLLRVQSFRTLWLAFPAIVVLTVSGYMPAFPALMVLLEGQGKIPFQPSFPLEVIGYLSGSIWPPLGVLVLFSALAGLISLQKSRSKEVGYWILLFLIPVSTALVADPKLRYFVYLLPYYLLLVVSGFCVAWRFAARRRYRAGSYFLRALFIILTLCVFFAWAFRSWNNIHQEGYRDAVRAMETDATDLTGFCAIGGGAGLFRYYSEREIFVPSSMEQFQQFVERYAEVRCAYRKRPWERAEHTEIGTFLRGNASSEQFRNVTVFTYTR